MAWRGSDTTGRVVLRHSLKFDNFRVSDAASACASAVVVKSLGTNLGIFRTGRLLGDPSLFGCLLPQVRVINTVIYEDDGF